MSAVEGRVVASLARALSVRFIYINETTQGWSCQECFKHFYEILFFIRFDARLPRPEPASGGKGGLICPLVSHVNGDPSS